MAGAVLKLALAGSVNLPIAPIRTSNPGFKKYTDFKASFSPSIYLSSGLFTLKMIAANAPPNKQPTT